MENLIGIVGADFVVLAADTTAARSIIAYKHDEDKIRMLDSHKLSASAGPQADCSSFVERMQANMALHELRTSLKMSTKATVSYIRNELATALRKAPVQVNMLLGGVDDDGVPALYVMDYLAATAQVNYGAQGYAAHFVSATLDRYWRKGLSLEEALDLLRDCIKVVRTRMVVSQPFFMVKVVTKEGVRVVDLEQAPLADAAVPGAVTATALADAPVTAAS